MFFCSLIKILKKFEELPKKSCGGGAPHYSGLELPAALCSYRNEKQTFDVDDAVITGANIYYVKYDNKTSLFADKSFMEKYYKILLFADEFSTKK